MRRTAIALLLVAAACAPADEAATDTAAAMDTAAAPAAPAAPAAMNLADLSGTWVGTSTFPDGRVQARTEMTATGTESGWRMNVINATDSSRRASTDVRVLSTAGDSLVTESGPYPSVLRAGQQVTVRSVYRLQGGRLVGRSHITYANGDTTSATSEMTRR